jgi:hypothetical protein
MTERAKSSSPESSGRTEPVTTFLDTSTRSTPGDQIRLLSEPNSDQPSDLISSRGSDLALSDLALGESETLTVLFSESDGHKNTDERWESDRYRLEKWSIAAKMTMIALVAIAIAVATAIPLVFLQDNEPSADATRQQIAVPKQTATETAPAAATQPGETLLASAEQDRPREPTNGLNSILTPGDTTADTKSIGLDQNPPSQALAATSPGGLIGKEELANGPTPGDTAADIKSIGQGQNPPPPAPAATLSPARVMDKEELASLLKRGRYLLSIGDIAPARLLLERAADALDASAAFDLAGTYDPAVLTRSHVSGIVPDLAMARMWYEKALSLGHSEAQQRLAQLQK